MHKFFTWAIEVKGFNMTQLAAALGYSERHLYRIRAGGTTDLVNFRARVIAHFGDEVRPFFTPEVSISAANIN